MPIDFIHLPQSRKTLSPWAQRTEQERKPPFHLSYSLCQLESPACPLSLDDKLIPDHKENREKQSNCCHRKA